MIILEANHHTTTPTSKTEKRPDGGKPEAILDAPTPHCTPRSSQKNHPTEPQPTHRMVRNNKLLFYANKFGGGLK
jgi:hypothetical protein